MPVSHVPGTHRDCRRGRIDGDDMSMMAPDYAGGKQFSALWT
jgi:hypothetical protein